MKISPDPASQGALKANVRCWATRYSGLGARGAHAECWKLVRATWVMAFVAGTLAACSTSAPDPLSSTDTAGWLQKACGVSLSAAPVLKDGKLMHWSASPGSPVRVDGIVMLLEADVPKVLDKLRNEAGLNLRGASDTRYSFQSPDGRPQERECELDTSARQLYFHYAE